MERDGNIKVIIHRGASQIGGVCTEVSTYDTRIFFDLGTPLEGEGNQNKLSVEGLTYGDQNADAVFLTHYYGDHVGEVPDILPGIPVYMQRTARRILEAQQKHKEILGQKVWAKEINELTEGAPLTIKDLTITPLSSDHSACDSLMYLIEGCGKRILITGDFRLHGYHSEEMKKTFEELGHIDLMISEGTNITRESEKYYGEYWAEQRFSEIFKEYKYVFLLASSSNIERIAGFLRCAENGKYALTDKYQRELMLIAKEYRMDDLIPEKINYYSPNLDEKMERRGFRFVVRASEKFYPIVEKYFEDHPDETCLIYSMWSGYRDISSVKKMLNYCDGKEKIVHVSGHVTKEDLEDVLEAVKPDNLIIHHTSAEIDELKAIKIPEGTRLLEAEDGKVAYVK